MIIIAHRGNLEGPNAELENTPDQLRFCIDRGFDVEVDIWFKNGTWWLGHDAPTYEVDIDFIKEISYRTWWHAKTIPTVVKLKELARTSVDIAYAVHYFFHQEDDVTLTSRGWLWTFPGKELTEHSICVMPEIDKDYPEGCAGVCTDFAQRYRRGK